MNSPELIPELDPREFTTKSLDELRAGFAKKIEPFQTVKYSEYDKAYWSKVFDVPEKKERNVQDYKKLLHCILHETIPNFQYTETNKVILKNFFNWVLGDSRNSDFILSRGILLVGTPGTGKTKLMESMMKFCREIKKRQFGICYSKEVTQKVVEVKDTSIINQFQTGNWCFDELGHETGITKIWGNNYNLIGDLLEYRYRRQNLINHGTTNIEMDLSSQKNLKAVYGDRVYSRIHEMFNVVYLNGKDWRAENY